MTQSGHCLALTRHFQAASSTRYHATPQGLGGAMRRREFVGLLGGAAIWPSAAHAQQPPIPVIGFLSSLAPRDLILVMPAFHDGLNRAGFTEGRNVSIEYRWAEGDYHLATHRHSRY